MATEAWERARDAVVALWRRARPDRADTVAAELAEVREDVLRARDTGDEEMERVLASDWQHRLRRLVRDDPQLAAELRRVLDYELTPLLPSMSQEQIGSLSIKTTTSGKGRTTILGQGTQHNY
jgi:hypothetical protein